MSYKTRLKQIKLGTYLTGGPRLAVDEEEDEDGDVALDESD